MSLRLLPSALALAAAVALAAPAAAAPPTARDVLARAKAAQGGKAWDAVRSIHATGRVEQGGLAGTLDMLTDVRTGRYRDAWDLGAEKGATAFDGKIAWSQDASGQSREEGAQQPRESAFTEAYRRAEAWWYPDRRPGEVKYAGERSEGGRRFHVLAITPAGGRAFELWVDAATWLFDRTVERIAPDTFTTTLSDWRTVRGVKLPFAAVISQGEAKYDQRIALAKVELNVPLDAARFALPPPPPRDFGFAGGQRSTTVPFAFLNNHVYVDVRLDGKGPYRFFLDTGGVNIVTPALAKELGLEAKGALPGGGVGEAKEDIGVAKVKRVEIGDAFLDAQTFFVYPIGAMDAVEGTHVDGLVGYEVFRRFIARLDYAHARLTLTDPDGWKYEGAGTAVPFVFNAHLPQVAGEIDGVPGRFDLDTGSRSSVDLFVPFVEEHHLVEKYGARVERIGGWGVGGASRGYVVRGRELKLGPVAIPDPVVGLATSKKGAFARTGVAGNVGGGVLSRFDVTFDYGRKQVIFEKNARFDARDTYDKAGWWIDAAGDAWQVMEVVPGTPAAQAGLKEGDRILAVDGQTPAELSLSELRRKVRDAPTGTRLTLKVKSGDVEREVPLTLRDLV